VLIYWFLLLIPIYFLFGKIQGGARTSQLKWQFFGLFLIILIGLRHRVGGDWYTYLDGLGLESEIQWTNLFNARDPAYTLFSWLSIELGGSIYGVNFICAIIFTFGLINFCRSQPYPWLAILVALPYLVIVVAMGYTRQAAAIGFLMISFRPLVQGRLTKYLVLVLLAGLIHKTAFIFAVFVLFRPGGGKLKGLLGVILLVSLIGATYLLEQADTFMLNYVVQGMESGGGQIRVLMNVLPALIFFVSWRKWGNMFDDRWLWGVFSILAVVCVPLVFFASTAVDRMALYLIPLQLVVWSRFPNLLKGRINIKFAFFIIAVYYAIVQFIYLIYGTYVAAWIPYDNLLLHIF